MAVSRRLRFEILRRDGHACRYCGAMAPDVALTVDHVIAVALGGSDEPNNLITACQPCNAGKSSTTADSPIVEDVDATAMLFAKAIERATEQRRAEIRDVDAKCQMFYALWADYSGDGTAEFGRPTRWPEDIGRFLAAGLSIEEILRFVEIAMASKASGSKVWRYFCACCWNEIGRRQELARTLIEDGEV